MPGTGASRSPESRRLPDKSPHPSPPDPATARASSKLRAAASQPVTWIRSCRTCCIPAPMQRD